MSASRRHGLICRLGDWITILGCIPAVEEESWIYGMHYLREYRGEKVQTLSDSQIKYMARSFVYQLVTMQENRAVLPNCMRDKAERRLENKFVEVYQFGWKNGYSSIVLAGLILPLHGGWQAKGCFCFPIIFMQVCKRPMTVCMLAM